MKTALIITEDIKQIVLTPQTEAEKKALKLFTPDDHIEVAIKSGTLFGYDRKTPMIGMDVNECQGGYLRFFENEESIMLVLTPKKSAEEANKEGE